MSTTGERDDSEADEWQCRSLERSRELMLGFDSNAVDRSKICSGMVRASYCDCTETVIPRDVGIFASVDVNELIA